MFNLICVGDPIIDTHVQIDDSSAECALIPHGDLKLCLDYGRKIPILNSFQNLGGNAANVSVGAVKLGLKTAIISTIGDDVNGKKIIQDLKKNGVIIDYLQVDKKSQSRYSIVLNYKGERTILSYSDKKNYEWPDYLLGTDWIYYTGLSEGFEEIHENLLRYLKERPTTRLAFNPGSYLLKYAPGYLKEILKRTDLLIVNLQEAEAVLKTKLTEEKTPSALIHGLLKMGVKEAVITDGESGAWAGNDDVIFKMKAYPVRVIGKTGAGDAFSAGYLAARFYGHDINHALAWGTANSSSVIQHIGSGSGLLDKDSLLKMIEEKKAIQPLEV